MSEQALLKQLRLAGLIEPAGAVLTRAHTRLACLFQRAVLDLLAQVECCELISTRVSDIDTESTAPASRLQKKRPVW